MGLLGTTSSTACCTSCGSQASGLLLVVWVGTRSLNGQWGPRAVVALTHALFDYLTPHVGRPTARACCCDWISTCSRLCAHAAGFVEGHSTPGSM